MERLVLIDGHAILHRAYHAYPPLTTSKDELINAVYGFTSILLTVLRQLKPKYVAVAFDLPKPTFRHKKYKGYKAHRPKVDEELINQIPRTHQVIEALNIPIFEVEGYEGDDIIGTIAKLADSLKSTDSKFFSSNRRRKSSVISIRTKVSAVNVKKENFAQSPRESLETIIVTGDKDALQLVDNNIKVFVPQRGKQPSIIFDRKAFLQKYGFEPRQLIDFKALAGDASDGIPGVKGIGPKTATELIVKFGDLKGIYDNLDKVDDKARAKLTHDRKQAFLSYKLAEIITNVPIKLDLKKCRLLDYDREKVTKLFEELEFKSLISKLPTKDWEELVEEKEQPEEKKKKQMELF